MQEDGSPQSSRKGKSKVSREGVEEAIQLGIAQPGENQFSKNTFLVPDVSGQMQQGEKGSHEDEDDALLASPGMLQETGVGEKGDEEFFVKRGDKNRAEKDNLPPVMLESCPGKGIWPSDQHPENDGMNGIGGEEKNDGVQYGHF